MRQAVAVLCALSFSISAFAAESKGSIAHIPPEIQIDETNPVTIAITAPDAVAARLLIPANGGLRAMSLQKTAEGFSAAVSPALLRGVPYEFEIKLSNGATHESDLFYAALPDSPALVEQKAALEAELRSLRASAEELEQTKANLVTSLLSKSGGSQ